MTRPRFIEPYGIVRARKIRRARLKRAAFALGALGLLAALAGCECSLHIAAATGGAA